MLRAASRTPVLRLATRLASSQQLGLQRYQAMFASALEVEFKAECRKNDREVKTLPVRLLASRGLALESLMATIVDTDNGSTVVQLRAFDGADFETNSSDSQLTAGCHVLLRKATGPHQELNGVIMASGSSSMCVRLNDEELFAKKRRTAQTIEEGRWHVLRTKNFASHDHKLRGLSAFCASNTAPPQLRGLVLTAFTHSQQTEELEAGPFTLYLADSPSEAHTASSLATHKLNPRQRAAIDKALSSRVALIQGPPGTGKTVCAGHLVQKWRERLNDIDWIQGTCWDEEEDFDEREWDDRAGLSDGSRRILLVAPSNVAVDNLLASFLECERAMPSAEPLQVVRLGNAARVAQELAPFTLESLMKEHPQFNQLKALRSEEAQALKDQTRCRAQDVGAGGGTLYAERGRNLGREAKRIQKSAHNLERSISRDLVRGCDVVATTCVSAGSAILAREKFGLLIVDEASQATEPEVLIALLRLERSGQVVLVGDHCQLPPVVIALGEGNSPADALAAAPLGMSLFERIARLVKSEGDADAAIGWIALDLLREQYRMHPALSAWPSKHFYSGLLVDAVHATDRPPIKGLLWPTAKSGDSHSPVVFMNFSEASESGTLEVQDSFSSYSNEAEARAAVAIVDAALRSDPNLTYHGVAIVTPYLAQQALILTFLAEGGADPERVQVRTVDGFQGREKDLVVLSAVRCNPQGDIGFTGDWRRINVALTRARRGLVVLGNAATLSTSPDWQNWLSHVTDAGAYIETSDQSAAPFAR